MSKIYLIRHAEKIRDGSKLTSRGRKQARYLRKKLKKEKITKIYSSSVNRCLETAEIINKVLRLKIKSTDLLKEIPGTAKEFPEKHEKEIKKVKKIFNELAKLRGNILVVSSGNVNRVLISMFLGFPSSYARFVQIPTCLNLIEKHGKGFRLVSINDVSHLPERLRVRQPY